MTIEYYTKFRYGQHDMYATDQTIAKAISTLTGRKTVSQSDKLALERLGLTFKQVLQPAQ